VAGDHLQARRSSVNRISTRALLIAVSVLANLGTAAYVDAQPVTGSGTANKIPKFTGTTTIGDSVIKEMSGKVGINLPGNSNPQAPLDVVGGAFFRGASATTMFFANNGGTGDVVDFRSGNIPRFFIANNGNVGVGTISPQARLEIAGQDGLRISGNQPYLTLNDTSDTCWTQGIIQYAREGIQVGVAGTLLCNDIRDLMTISPLGTIISPSVEIRGYPGELIALQIGESGDNLGAISSGWLVYSSQRWKENVMPLGDALAKVQKLRGVSFDWKDSKKHDIGFIAEDVGQVIPEVVTFEKNGKDASALDYARLTAVLVEAVKEQQKQILADETQLRTQEQQIDALTKAVAALQRARIEVPATTMPSGGHDNSRQ
jgi:endosialidase-like protein